MTMLSPGAATASAALSGHPCSSGFLSIGGDNTTQSHCRSGGVDHSAWSAAAAQVASGFVFSQTHSVGPGLYDRDELSSSNCAQCAQGALNRRRMVSKIIVNRHTVRLSQQFQPRLTPLKDASALTEISRDTPTWCAAAIAAVALAALCDPISAQRSSASEPSGPAMCSASAAEDSARQVQPAWCSSWASATVSTGVQHLCPTPGRSPRRHREQSARLREYIAPNDGTGSRSRRGLGKYPHGHIRGY